MKDLFNKIGWALLSIFLWFIVICLCIGVLIDVVAAFKRDIIIGVIAILSIIAIIVLNIIMPDRWRKYK